MQRDNRHRCDDSEYLVARSLWCNERTLLARILPRVQPAKVDAQYALYAEGRGVPADEVMAYVWLSRAAAQGDSAVRDLRRLLMNPMPGEAIARAEQQLHMGSA